MLVKALFDKKTVFRICN